MIKLFHLCLWQVVLGIFTVSVFSISMFSISGPAYSQEVQTTERGIRMRGPKSTDVFPYDRYGPITKRDTLWKIALTVRPDSRLSVYQVMEALYQANPNSFVDSNFNHLVEGSYLKIPSFDRMMSVNTTAAKQKSRQDDKDWQKKQPKKVAIKATTPKEPSVNKKDLDTVKVEINDQIQKIDHEQQKRLTNIQNDVLDSIDGLQAILKENEDLRKRLTLFNSKLGTMQKEVAKGKEIKLQMDDMIKLQQALLEKAEAREQELLLEKQQVELEKDNIFSSLWFIVLMATLPAILILLVVALIFKRRKTDTITADTQTTKEPKTKSENIIKEPKADIDEIDELSLDDELSLEEDDVIHLDDDDGNALDDLDDLDDLEDIILDDELEGLELESGESEALVDNQLDQSDLDDLLGNLGDDELVVEDAELSSIEEIDIDDALMAVGSEEEPLPDETDETEMSDPDDIDALLESMSVDEDPLADETDETEMSDPDDIDALLESMSVDEDPLEDETVETEMSDPDDIDALLESMAVDEAPLADETVETEMSDPDDIDALLESMAVDEAPLADETVETEMSDPDDIDALLESVAVDEAPLADETAETEMSDPDDIDALLESMAVDETPLADETAETEISDPDDIDALLESMAVDEAPLPDETDETEMSDPDDIDALLESMVVDEKTLPDETDETEMSDPDDIDALLESVAVDEAPLADETAETEISDPDDIDALLESMAVDEETLPDETAETEISDPDDIDALLESMAVDEETLPDETAETEMSDPDDIDALLASMDVDGMDSGNNTEEETVDKEHVQKEESQNKAKIESLTEEYIAPLLAADFSDILTKSTEADLTEIDSSQEQLADDDFNSLIVDAEAEQNTTKEAEFDIGDDLADGAFDEDTLAKLLSEQETEHAVELTPDFTDQNVLAELLNDENNDNSQVSEATEINDIQELDSLDFDELLANIEEESTVGNQSVDFNEHSDVSDDISLSDFDNITSNIPSIDDKNTSENEQSFVSVDSLLSDSQYEVNEGEPYDKAKIDVGLNEFPEFTDGVKQIDVDIDENGMAAKLDLAKVYIEIGDQDNAQVILEEVIKRGDAQQQVTAQDLLDNL